MKKSNVTRFVVLLFISLSCVWLGISYGQDSDDDIPIGATGINYLYPKTVLYEYETRLEEIEVFTVKYNGENFSFRIFRNQQEIELKDKVLSGLKVSPIDFEFEEFYFYEGMPNDPKLCRVLYFGILEHKFVENGNLKLCDQAEIGVKLFGGESHPVDEAIMVYDSNISDKIHPEGFWKDVTEEFTD